MHASRGDGAARAGRHAHRARLAVHARRHPRRLLRHAHAAEPGRQPVAPPTPRSSPSSPGTPSLLPRDREGDPHARTSTSTRRTTARSSASRCPPLTEERRKILVKNAHKHAEEGRVAIRNVRRDVNDHLKKMLKDHEVSEDDEKQAMAEVQKLTDQHIEQINEIAEEEGSRDHGGLTGRRPSRLRAAPYNRGRAPHPSRLHALRRAVPAGAGPQPLRVRRAALRPLRPRARGQEHAPRPPGAARADPVALRRRAARRQPRPPHQPRRGLHARCCRAPRLGALVGLPRLVDQGRGRQPHRLLQGPRPVAWPCPWRRRWAPPTSACPRPATPAARSPPTRRAAACKAHVFVPQDVAPRLRHGDGGLRRRGRDGGRPHHRRRQGLRGAGDASTAGTSARR